jgi:hypothetical protein
MKSAHCYGASPARVEAQVTLPALARRLVNPRLVTDPPPYRPNPVLRGPRQLLVEFDTVATAARRRISPCHRDCQRKRKGARSVMMLLLQRSARTLESTITPRSRSLTFC